MLYYVFSSFSYSFCDIKLCALHISRFPDRLLASTVVHVGVVFLFLRTSEIRRYHVVMWSFLAVPYYFSAKVFLFLHSSLTRLFFCSPNNARLEAEKGEIATSIHKAKKQMISIQWKSNENSYIFSEPPPIIFFPWSSNLFGGYREEFSHDKSVENPKNLVLNRQEI